MWSIAGLRTPVVSLFFSFFFFVSFFFFFCFFLFLLLVFFSFFHFFFFFFLFSFLCCFTDFLVFFFIFEWVFLIWKVLTFQNVFPVCQISFWPNFVWPKLVLTKLSNTLFFYGFLAHHWAQVGHFFKERKG